jgi:hypothetical protein
MPKKLETDESCKFLKSFLTSPGRDLGSIAEVDTSPLKY